MTVILGISCYYHDAAAALIVDGEVLAAAEEERFTRVKHDASFPLNAVNFCLEKGELEAGDIDYVAFYESPISKAGRVISSGIASLPRSIPTLSRALVGWATKKIWIESHISGLLGVHPKKVIYVDHHLSHSSSAFLSSPFADASTLTIDGVGEWSTATIGRASASTEMGVAPKVENRLSLDFPHSLGLLYSAFTEYLGFEVNEGEFKVMGMAAYGTPRYRERIDRICRLHQDGSLTLDMRYFTFHYDESTSLHRRFIDLFRLPPRSPGQPFGTPAGLSQSDRHYADVAASIQNFCEDAVVAMAMAAYRHHPSENLAYAGGVALNGLANAAILDRTPFSNIYIPSAPGDSGGALGAAQYVYHVLLGKSRTSAQPTKAGLGKDYTRQIEMAIKKWGAESTVCEDESLLDHVANAIHSGKVVGWHQGGFEFGPRALGYRSILADPTLETMKDNINRKVKYRESFRPFAPAVLAEYAGKYFSGPLEQHPARFMQFVLPAREGVTEKIPAVTHFGTSRVQTVHSSDHPLLSALIKAFAELSGHPVLLNTSFNLKGEPIVASPEDSLSTFQRSGLDVLVMGDHVIRKV